MACGRAAPPASADSQIELSGTVSPPAPEALSSSPPIDATPASLLASADGATDATLAEAPAEPHFDLNTWLAQHEITRVEHDATCARRAAAADAGFGLKEHCACYASLSLTSDPPIDLLVCAHSARASSGPGWPIVTFMNTAVYAADRGRLRLVLDVPTYATVGGEHMPDPGKNNEQNEEFMSGCGVELGVRAEGDRVVVSDRGDGFPGGSPPMHFTCEETIAHVGRPGSALDDLSAADIAAVKRTYRTICRAQGEWRWNGSTLVRVPPVTR